ncbi:MAG: hypothetical protein IJ190_00885 [Prevotella sp.]|nr:hypothetical protein [Prevotella sp.]
MLALAGCSSGGSADWKDLREQANDLYNVHFPLVDLESASLLTGVSNLVDWSQQVCRLESTTD